MSFFDVAARLQDYDFDSFFNSVTKEQIEYILSKDTLSKEDFMCLLSPAAEDYIEVMAQKAHKIAINNFGRSVTLYTPIYIANYCVNKCAYCGYNVENDVHRKKLTMEEIEKEAQAIYASGLRHIILLTGESRFHSPVSYIKDAVKLLKKYFSSICIEIYPLEENEYRELIEAGVDSLTIYQETYNMKKYDEIHLAGPKKNYRYRVETPERAARAGVRGMGVGALYGLDSWRKEAYFSGLHARYIQDMFPYMEISMSVPRIRPHAGSFTDIKDVTDKNLVQIMLAFKIFLKRSGINVTTRESAELRDNLIPLGVTKISAGVSTEVGGHSCKTEDQGEKQFEISDKRSVGEIREMLKSNGYCPVMKDWEYV
ncbi:2-iminoacetate synthase [Clostridium pasteurianum DSM 525 = ATCC 6013]|uniref:2-iminoacetate synthase n=1 Tax=Clostridium pasteurianum DSM 525 = ATCC 6013 TaxID=1262449 RepID=A0A0H3J5V9_CLOPA|nr:2-iminoacetate synthase ThiH [Clostridium pasteurianum]AJA49401.1 2-iminoacetate synthase [Clostridium pasteurianum DSM 525 = ATCC 6013]AJA53389.1 2-iminoacetate synthase [Clostridium pasteurianum DSM 525 = ATCC 6013]AOZ76572.1 thiamine biosynthesis protein ThiH [Clostridium pasteurianum DSM 525 = ATCC 6013]ELP58483.1 thiamine biosynthesis protein ThiH [Clostridium pasteurianum DSM 525 = ATCC 6013]KRU14586.1 thiazole biosynthesis protein ThiH [Clostridium pasteurianum DSM 525 = ATCC 6013]